MAPIARYAAAPLLLAIAAACADGRSETLVDATLERDLKLASTASIAMAPVGTDSLMQLETAPPAAETPAPKPRAAASGPRRVSAPRPTAPSAPTREPAPVSDADAVLATITQPSGEDVVQSGTTVETEAAEGDAVADAGVALPRPVPVVIEMPSPGSGTGDYDRGRGGSGGGWGGVVIRGGDIDDCRVDRPQTGRRRPARRGGGMGDARWPIGGGVAQGGSRGGGTWPATRGRSSGGGRTGGGSSGPVWRGRQ